MDCELNIPRDNLKETLLKLVKGPKPIDYPTVSDWSCSFISYENFCKNGYRSFDHEHKQLLMSFEEYASYIEESVCEQSFWIGKRGIVFFDENQATSILHISFVDVNTSKRKVFNLYFYGYNQPYW